MRNVAIALGNSKNPAAVQPLVKALKTNRYPIVRGHVAWALAELNAKESLPALKQALICEDEDLVVEELKAAILRLEEEA